MCRYTFRRGLDWCGLTSSGGISSCARSLGHMSRFSVRWDIACRRAWLWTATPPKTQNPEVGPSSLLDAGRARHLSDFPGSGRLAPSSPWSVLGACAAPARPADFWISPDGGTRSAPEQAMAKVWDEVGQGGPRAEGPGRSKTPRPASGAQGSVLDHMCCCSGSARALELVPAVAGSSGRASARYPQTQLRLQSRSQRSDSGVRTNPSRVRQFPGGVSDHLLVRPLGALCP